MVFVMGGGLSAFAQVSDPPLPLLVPQIKQTSLSTNLNSLLAFEQQAARPHFQLQ